MYIPDVVFIKDGEEANNVAFVGEDYFLPESVLVQPNHYVYEVKC